MSKTWKEIKGYEGRYLISDSGDVMSLNYRGTKLAKLLTWKMNNKGYAWVELRKNGIKDQRLIHRLVAETFIENPNGFKLINHKDENRLNNDVSNLEWCDHSYNVRYSLERHPERRVYHGHGKYDGIRKGKHTSLAVIQLDKDGSVVQEWENARTVFIETGMSDWSIAEVCRGNRHTAYGYLWRYANQDIVREN